MPYSHMRFNPFDRERYTDAQALELRQLRALYTTHLVRVFGEALPDAFALRMEGDDYYPRYTATTLTPPPMTPVPPTSILPTQSFKPFAETLIRTLAVYEEARRQRWTGKGHPNDPTRLFGIFLRNTCQVWLSHAPSNAATLRQVTALRQYLEALAREQVFTAEGQGHDSMTVLLRNLATPLSLLEKRLRYEISLHTAREHFREMKEGVAQALNEAAQYLFYALAAKDRSQLPFSLVNLQAQVVSKELTQALETREGLLLKQWIHAPGVVRTLLPQADVKASKSVGDQKPVNLLGLETPTPLLDEKGGAHPTWLEFLQQSDALEAQLDPLVKKLPPGICPLLLESKMSGPQEGTNSLVAEAIQLHGLLEVLAHYQAYLHQCWQLAGFGGDHCVYDQMSEAVTSILTELHLFNQALVDRLSHFQERLDRCYQAALASTEHLAWQANYRVAKASQEKLLGVLTGCNEALKQVMTHTQDTAARSERRRMASQAYAALKSAPRFLNQARQHVGLAPKEHYPGLEALPESKGAAADPFALSLAPDDLPIDQVLVMLFPISPQSVVWLSRLCAQTPTTPPWSIFRGSYQRYAYLHNNTRLKKIGQDLMHLQLHAETPMTPEKSTFIEQLRRQLREEQARIHRLRARLWWPFHRASLEFFRNWQQGIQEKLRYLMALSRTTSMSLSRTTSTQGIQHVLLVNTPVLEDTPHSPESKAMPSVPLSSASRQRLTHLYPRYRQTSPERRAGFDGWLQDRFDTPLWGSQGQLQFSLTEEEGSAILEKWTQSVLQDARNAVEELRTTRHLVSAQLQRTAIQTAFTPVRETPPPQ